MRTPQPAGTKGSLKWIQLLVNDHPAKLNAAISEQLQISDSKIQWLSPLKTDENAEYRDGSFLDLLGLGEFKGKLRDFWPRNGPQWDALGKGAGGGPYFLVEAKANIPEIMSSLGAKSERSIRLIRKSLTETREHLGCKDSDLWEKGFYQYVNRLAHLHFLRNHCGVNAYLIFVYFINDPNYIPTSREEWAGALELQKGLLSIKNHRMKKFVAELYIDVKQIRKSRIFC